MKANLPELGVRIGCASADHVEVSAGALLNLGPPDCIALVPVVKQDAARAPGYRAFRRQAPEDRSPLSAADIDASIKLMRPEAAERALDQRGQVDCHRPRRQAAVDLRHYRVAEAERGLWQGADGVLVLLLYDAPDTQSLAAKTSIARALAAVLDDRQLQRCIVPTASVELAESNQPLVVAPLADRVDRAGVVQRESKEFCFAVASCQFTPGMIDGTPLAELIAGPADKSYERLAQRLAPADPAQRPQLLILAGDQVYVDATAGLFDPTTADGRFRRPYEQIFSSPYVQDVRRQLQICMLLDDHEIDDNFENDDPDVRELMKLGRDSYLEFQRDIGPLPAAEAPSENPNYPADVDQGLWCALSVRGYDFFFADTRTERGKRTASDLQQKHIAGRRQLSALLRWMARPNPDGRPRFVVSPSILLPRRLSTLEHPTAALHSDAWDGYPRSQHLILNWMARKRISDVVFLSGDEHRCCVATATLDATQPAIVVRSLHCSGMYTPFPFANSIPEDFARTETLATGWRKRWRVDSEFSPAGQGFGVIHVKPEAGRWHVRATFDLDSGPHSVSLVIEPAPLTRGTPSV